VQLYLNLLTELGFSIGDGQVWLAIGVAVLLFVGLMGVGVLIARSVGVLERDAQAAETVGVGLATALIVVAAIWASLRSGGRSAFTPVAIALAVVIGLTWVRAVRRRLVTETRQSTNSIDGSKMATRAARARPIVLVALAGGLFIVAVALLFGSTLAPSPREGLQPVEFMDEDFYSVLSMDLSETGTETILSPSGFTDIEGMPSQDWYHWGELWLGAAVISAFGIDPIAARHFVVLPILLLAAALLTGTLVRRVTGSRSTAALVLGALGCLFLAPIPLVPGPYFSSRAVGLIFGITTYGLAAVAVLLTMFAFASRPTARQSWTFAAFVGAAIAFIVPAHVVIAALAAVFAATTVAVRALRRRAWGQQLEILPSEWRRTTVCAGVGVVASVVWGTMSGHGIPATGVSPAIAPFNPEWRASMAIIVLGGGAFYAMAIAGYLARRDAPRQVDLYVAAGSVVVAAAIAWGARLGDFNMFHVFFGAIAVFATPAAAVAMWSLWMRVREMRRPALKVGLVVLFLVQIEVGLVLSLARLQEFGPHAYPPVPTAVLEEIRDLPGDGKVAYSCGPTEEISYWVPRLLSVGVHAGRRVVPMCFEADALSVLLGAELSADAESPLFRTAPQRALYPTSSARPTSATVSAFLRSHGIDYIYVDPGHPNLLVPDAIPVVESGGFKVLRLQ
jgi:hypothetical protein